MIIPNYNLDKSEYQNILELLKKYQTFPVLFYALECCIKNKENITEISSILSDIFICEDEQFYGIYHYNKENCDMEKFIDEHYYPSNEIENTHQDNFLGIIDSFGRILSYLNLDIIWDDTDYLSSSDHEKLKGIKIKEDIDENDLIVEDFDEINETQNDNNQKKQDLDFNFEKNNELGLNFFTFAYYLKDVSFFKKYSNHIQNMSSHFESYFYKKDIYNESSENYSIDEGVNKKELLKIISSIIFSRLMVNFKIKFSYNSIDDILRDRKSNLVFENIITSSKYPENYIFAVFNILIISSLLDEGCIENEILNKKEVSGEFLNNIIKCKHTFTQEKLRFSILFLTNNIKNLIFPLIGNEGSIFDGYTIFNYIAKGIPNKTYFLYYDEINEELDSEISSFPKYNDFFKSLKESLISNLCNWVFPLNLMQDIQQLSASSFLDYTINQNMINDALVMSDKNDQNSICLLPSEWVGRNEDDTWYHLILETEWIKNAHPAINSIYFNGNPFPQNIKKNVERWIQLSMALLNYGQPFYSCLSIALFFQLKIILENFSDEYDFKIPPKEISDLLFKLSKFQSFNLIEESLIDYSKFGKYYSKNIGTLSAFMSSNINDSQNELVKENFSNFFKVSIEDIDIDLSNLCEAARDEFEKGIYLIKEKPFLYSGYAVYSHVCFGRGLEAELKYRTRNLASFSMNEIKGLGISFDESNTSNFNLGNLFHILVNMNQLSNKTRLQMKGIYNLTKHPQFNFFKNVAYLLKDRRNKSGHYSDENYKPDLKKDVELCLVAKKELIDDGFLKILNSTGT